VSTVYGAPVAAAEAAVERNRAKSIGVILYVCLQQAYRVSQKSKPDNFAMTLSTASQFS